MPTEQPASIKAWWQSFNPKKPPTILSIGALLWKAVAAWSSVDFILSIRNETFFIMFTMFLNYGWLVVVIGGIVWAFISTQTTEGRTLNPALVVVVGILAFIWGVLVTVLATGSVPTIIGSWGTTGPSCWATVDTSRLLSFRKEYDLALVCGVTNPTIDKLADTRVSISNLFVIRAEPLTITTPYSKDMTEAINKLVDEARKTAPEGTPMPVQVQIWWEPILVKKGTDMATIHRLSDVTRYGGKILRQQYFE